MKKFWARRSVRILGPLVLAGATAGTALYVLARPYVARYREKQETCAHVGDGKPQLYLVSDSGSSRAQLDPGFYHFDASGFCYHAECDLDLRDPPMGLPPEGWFRSRRKCRGDELSFVTGLSVVSGFMAPAAVKKLKLRVVRDGKVLFDDTVDEHACSPHFCLVSAFQ